jgi:HlyD family type I secretion membrane fusion protein
MPTLPDADVFDLDQSMPRMKAPTSMRSAWLIGVLAVAIAVGGFGMWAVTVPLDSAIVAHGKVTLAGKRKEVQHLSGGIVSRFTVKDGDHVREGDVLVELDPLVPAARLASARIAYLESLATEARLIAERDGAEAPAFPAELTGEAAIDAEVAAIVAGQERLFAATNDESAGQATILQSRMDQLKDQIAGLEAERQSVRDQLEMATEEQATLEALYEKQYTTRARVLATRREVSQLGGMIGRLSAQIASAEKEIGEARLTLAQIGMAQATDVLGELKGVQSRIVELREQYAAGRGEMDRTVIRAPASGTVFGSQVHTLGAVLRAGETILEIVPDDDQLVIEVRLRPVDVDEVQVGQTTEVKLSAFNQRTTPSLQGRVSFVSADAFSDPRTLETFFVANVEVTADQLAELGDHHLQPGMPAEALIKTGQRTALTYLLQPLADSMNRAWREH